MGTPATSAVVKPSDVSVWFEFEESGKDRLSDLNGVPNGIVQFLPGVVGQATRFEGGSHLQLPADSRFARQNFTLETWVRRRSTDWAGENAAGAGVLFGGSAGSFSLVMSREGYLYLSHVAVESVFSQGRITDTSWHHVAMVRSGTEVAFFIDGKDAGTVIYGREFSYGGPFAIGALGTPVEGQNYSFFGDLDDLAFYPRPLTAAEVTAVYRAYMRSPGFGCTGMPPGAVSWWQAEDGGRDTLNLNDGELLGGTEVAVAGFTGRGFQLRGGASRVQIVNPSGLNLQDLTIEMWLKRDSASIASDAPAGAGLFAGGMGSYGMVILHGGGLGLGQVGAARFDTGPRIVDTEWHHVAATKSGRTIRIYVDGQETDQGEIGDVFAPSEVFAIGAGAEEIGGYYFSFLGMIDELGVYSRPLSGAEIEAIWKAGERGKCVDGLALNIESPEEVQEGVPFAYVVNVVNYRTNRLDEVVVTNRIPAGFQVRETHPEIGTAEVTSDESGSEVVWTAGALEPGVAQRLGIQLGGGPVGKYWLEAITRAGSDPDLVIAKSSIHIRPECSPAPAGLLSWWRGESNAVDSVTGNPGGEASGVSYVRGKVGAAFSVNGSPGSGLPLGSPAGFKRTEFSIEGWVRRGDVQTPGREGDAGTILGADDGGWYFSIRNDGALIFGKTDFSGVTSVSAVTDRKWHHVAVTRSVGEVRFYTDGVLVGTQAYPETFVPDREYSLGGLLPSGRNAFLGDLDEIAFYDRVLTATEIAAVAAAGGAPKCAEDLVLTSTPGGPIPIGEDWEVQMTVTSEGKSDSTQVVLTHVVPPGLQFQSATASQGTVENLAGVVRADLGRIPAGGSATVRYVLRPLLAGNYMLTAAVQRLESELSQANNQVALIGAAVLLAVSVETPAPVTEPEPLEFAVTLSAPTRGTVRVAYRTEGVTATAGEDYQGQAGTLEFAPGTVRQVVTVPVVADGLYETNETVRLVLSEAVGATLGTALSEGMIQSPDPLPMARVRPLLLSEGDSGQTPFRFVIELDRPSGLVSRIRYATTNDTAKAPTDYTAVEGLLEIAPGHTNAEVVVLVNGDTTEEPNETLVLTFSDLEGLRMANLGGVPVPAIGTIVNDDAVPGLVRSFTWDAVPSDATAREAFPARLTARDGAGDVVAGFNGAVGVRGYAGPGLPSSVILSEIVTSRPQGVELQNVSGEAVDVGGWQIHLYDVSRWPAPRMVFTVPAGTVVPPQAVFTLEAVLSQFQVPGVYPQFRMLGSLIWPVSGAIRNAPSVPIGVVLTDALGVVVDSFFAGDAEPREIGVPRILAEEEWSGPAFQRNLNLNGRPAALRRPPGQRRNGRTATDWALTIVEVGGNFGQPNPGLVLPFEDAVVLPVAPEAVADFASGVWNGNLTLNGYAPWVRLLADDGNGHRGLSAPIRTAVTDDLEVSLTVTPGLVVTSNVSGSFEVTVTNKGSVLSSNVTVAVVLPYGSESNVRLGPLEVSQGTAGPLPVGQGVGVEARFGELPPGGVATLRFGARPSLLLRWTLPRNLVTTARVRRQQPELNLANNEATAVQELAASCGELGPETVAWWRAEDDYSDAVGGNTGTPVGAAGLGEGRVGSRGFRFGGGEDVIRIADAASLDFGSGEPFALELWFRARTDSGDSFGLLAKGTPEPLWKGYSVGLEQGQVVLRLGDGERADVLPLGAPLDPDLRDGQWHHLVISVVRGDAPSLWGLVDGKSLSSPVPVTASGDLSNDQPLELGGAGGSKSAWAGELDEVVLRRMAAIGAEARAAYEAGGHGHCRAILEIQPTAPRFRLVGGVTENQWIGLDPGVAGQPYRFEFELRNRGPLPEAVWMFVKPDARDTNYVFQTPSGTVPADPSSGEAVVNIGLLPVNGVVPMSVDWTRATVMNRWDLSAVGLDAGVRSTYALVTLVIAADTDGDGIPDEYEQTSGLNPNSAADAGSDDDLDGYTAAQEFEAGTKANDVTSRLRLRVEEEKALFEALASRQYRLERRQALGVGEWEVIQSFRPETDGLHSMTLPEGDGTDTYYRVVALLPY